MCPEFTSGRSTPCRYIYGDRLLPGFCAPFTGANTWNSNVSRDGKHSVQPAASPWLLVNPKGLYDILK